MVRRFSGLVVVILAVAGGMAPAQMAQTTPHFPLEVGAVWTYKSGENRFQLKVVRFEKIGETNCARIELTSPGGKADKPESVEHVAVTKDGVVRYSFDGKKAEPPINFLKLPIEQNATWKVDSKVDGQPLRGGFKIGKQKDVKVPAGIYDTTTVSGVDLEANGVKVGLTYYYAENVGLVKQVIDIGGRRVVVELERYEPGKKPQ